MNRLRWRCRRGMLENDLILARFLEGRGEAITEAELNEMFPSGRSAGPPDPADAELPRIPGYEILAVLGRGYSLVWDASGQRLVRAAAEVGVGDQLQVRLHDGRLTVNVTSKENE